MSNTIINSLYMHESKVKIKQNKICISLNILKKSARGRGYPDVGLRSTYYTTLLRKSLSESGGRRNRSFWTLHAAVPMLTRPLQLKRPRRVSPHANSPTASSKNPDVTSPSTFPTGPPFLFYKRAKVWTIPGGSPSPGLNRASHWETENTIGKIPIYLAQLLR